MLLAGRVAIVTGAAAGIGRASTIELAREGAKVAIADINDEKGRETVKLIEEIKGEGIFKHTDISDEQSIVQCTNEVVEKFGRIDILVNCATHFFYGHLKGKGNGTKTGMDKDISPKEWETNLQTNVVGYANFIKHVVKYMRNNELTNNVYSVNEGAGEHKIDAGSRGSIINISSVGGFKAMPEVIPYAVAKAAELQLTRCCALDFAEWKIRVNAITPGPIVAPMHAEHIRAQDKTMEQDRELVARIVPLKRHGAPEEIAHAVVFLASDKASFMTGSTMVVDGGRTI